MAALIKNCIKAEMREKKRWEENLLKDKDEKGEHNESHESHDIEMTAIQKPEQVWSFQDFDNDVVKSDEHFKQFGDNIEMISADEHYCSSMRVDQSLNTESSQSRDKSEISKASCGITDKLLKQSSKSGYSI